MTVATQALFAPPAKDYLRMVVDLAQSDVARRSEGVARLLVSKASRARRFQHRNRMWADAVSLLADGKPWTPENDNPSLLIDAKWLEGLATRVKRIADPPPGLADLTAEVLESTWPSFEAFQGSREGKTSFIDDTENRVGNFELWFDRNLPYVMIGLPGDVQEAQSIVSERINWMLDKLEPTELDQEEDGLRGRFAFEAWAYARARWAEASSCSA